MTLEVAVERRLGSFELKAEFTAEAGLTALFGPSGSGKTSLLRMVAGLDRPDKGRVVVGSRVLVDTQSRTFTPPHRRRAGYVFQEPRLFPHLSVRQNLLFGRLFAPRAERKADLSEIVDLLGIGYLLGRRPGGLSGGEKSRVAIGRALLSEPQMLLMDEPLASLDEARRLEIMPYLERLRDHARVPMLYVSHSVTEVARLAAKVVVMHEGKVAAAGPAADILHRPDLRGGPPRRRIGEVSAG